MDLQTVITILSSLIWPIGLFYLKRWSDKRDKAEAQWRAREKEERQRGERAQTEREAERERYLEKLILSVIQSVNANMALSEATARAVQRIPDAQCNGDMSKALEYATDIKHKQKDVLQEMAVSFW